MKIVKYTKDEWMKHSCVVIVLDQVMLPVPIVAAFDAKGRDDAEVYFEHPPANIIEEFGGRYPNAQPAHLGGNDFWGLVSKYSETPIAVNDIVELFENAYNKCLSSYGNGVANAADWGCDASIIVTDSTKDINLIVSGVQAVGKKVFENGGYFSIADNLDTYLRATAEVVHHEI